MIDYLEGVETYSYDEVVCMLEKLAEYVKTHDLPEHDFDNMTLKQIKALVENNKKEMQ